MIGPREKLMTRGVKSLEDAELFSVLLGTGIPGRPATTLAQDLLDRFGSVPATLSAPWEQLRQIPGIGVARFSLFQACIELAHRTAYREISERVLINSTQAVSDFLMAHLGGLPHEVFAVLFLDASHRLIRYEQLFVGTLTQTSVYPREVARRCLQLNAAAIIAAHNHPSGVAEPSQADRLLTTSLRRSLAVLEIELLDHLIVAGDRTVSASGI